MVSLQGKRALVTGGSRGVGEWGTDGLPGPRRPLAAAAAGHAGHAGDVIGAAGVRACVHACGPRPAGCGLRGAGCWLSLREARLPDALKSQTADTPGAAVSKILADRGAKVAINYASNQDRAEQTRAGLAGSGHIIVSGDAFSHEGVDKIAAEAVKGLGGLDIVVSNVGWTQFANFNDIGESWHVLGRVPARYSAREQGDGLGWPTCRRAGG